MREEIWKDIKGYEGKYMVSNLGIVKSLERMKWCGLNGGCYYKVPEKILKGVDDGYGYLQVKLYKDGEENTCRINRLVAQAFLPNPDNLPEVNHKNEDKTDNRVENLEWCSRSYNINYGTRNKKVAEKLKGKKHSEEHNKKISEKLKGKKHSEEHIKKISEKNINNPKKSKPIIAIHKINGLILEFPSAKEAERQTGIANSNICACLKGRQKSCGGFYWFYLD